MRTTCLVNNYNYQAFVGEAVDSALAQSIPFDEIIVVDDGSTDGSLAYLQQRYSATPSIQIVSKPNGGQLSAFNVGLEHANGDVVFFLDADDRYQPEYLKTAMEVYQTEPADFVIAGIEYFGASKGRPQKAMRRRNLGYSTVATLLDNWYVGGPTSALSMRRTVAEAILPYPREQDWWTRADDVLVFGASIVGARKYHLGVPLIEYRLHDANNHWGRRMDASQRFHHALATNRVRQWYAARASYDLPYLSYLLHREFATIERPSLGEWWYYQRMSNVAKLPFRLRFRQFLQMARHFCRRQSHSPPPSASSSSDDATQYPLDSPSPQRRLAG